MCPGTVAHAHHDPGPADARRWRRWEEQRQDLERSLEPDTPRSLAPRDAPGPLPPDAIDGAPYVELHAHCNYSLLEGASSIDELVETARAQGHRALALTDHDGMFGAMEFARAAKEAGLRPITGLELTLSHPPDAAADGDAAALPRRSHLTLLAENQRGYANLCRLSSLAFGLQEESDAGKEARRLDPCLPIEQLAAHSEGLIVLSGCRAGRIPRLAEAGRLRDAAAELQRLIEWFGADNVFVELQDNLVFNDRPRNRALVRLAASAGVAVVGTGNVHYHQRDRSRLQDVLVAIKHRLTLDESHRERRPNAEFFLRPPVEQAQRFARYHPDAAANSVRIARRCTFDLTQDMGYTLPAPPLPSGRSPHEELSAVCWARLRDRYAGSPEQARAEARLTHELRVIERQQLSGFFLIYCEIFTLAHEVAREVRGPGSARALAGLPPGRGRGSSVASIVCYLIGLSHIDPIANQLTIHRFLNEDMQTLPDIDLDFPRDIRERLIERVHEKWGKEHAALVAIFPTYRLRSAIRDVGKALGLPAAELDRLAKRATPYDGVGQLPAALARDPQSADRAGARGWRDLVDLAQQLAGFPRHLSQHVGGW